MLQYTPHNVLEIVSHPVGAENPAAVSAAVIPDTLVRADAPIYILSKCTL